MSNAEKTTAPTPDATVAPLLTIAPDVEPVDYEALAGTETKWATGRAGLVKLTEPYVRESGKVSARGAYPTARKAAQAVNQKTYTALKGANPGLTYGMVWGIFKGSQGKNADALCTVDGAKVAEPKDIRAALRATLVALDPTADIKAARDAKAQGRDVMGIARINVRAFKRNGWDEVALVHEHGRMLSDAKLSVDSRCARIRSEFDPMAK